MKIRSYENSNESLCFIFFLSIVEVGTNQDTIAQHVSYTFTVHLSLVYVSNSISESIYINPLITTIKKNKIISLLFNVGLTISLTFYLPYSFSYIYIYVITFIHFNYLILKCSNKSNQSLQNR